MTLNLTPPPSADAQFEIGRRLERERCRSIMSCPEAVGRPLAAKVVALETNLDVAAARKLLAALLLDDQPDPPAPASATKWGGDLGDPL